MTTPACPVCGMENTYSDGRNYVCPDCFHEWPLAGSAEADGEAGSVVKDSNGTPLADGDSAWNFQSFGWREQMSVLGRADPQAL